MRVVFFGSFWAILIVLGGIFLGFEFEHLILPALGMSPRRGVFAVAGLLAGIVGFLLLQQRGTLPGLRQSHLPPSPLTPRRIFAGIIWLGGFAILGSTIGFELEHRLFHALSVPPGRGALTIAGLAVGVAGFVVAANKGWLAGVGRRPGARDSGPAWGLAQAAWLTIGVLGMQFIGAFVCTVIITIFVRVVDALTHIPVAHGAPMLAVAGALSGYLTAALWSVWYINRLGPARVRAGGPNGIAWRPAPGEAYLAAALFAVLIVIVVVAFFYFVPPNQQAVESSPMAKVFGHAGWPIFTLLILAVFIAPPVEEWVFRGGVFSALCLRWPPLVAGLVTTALFVALHAPEKIHYPLGFIDVAMLGGAAMWLRVRFNSIRPGILLHVLYNAGGVLAAGLVHHLA